MTLGNYSRVNCCTVKYTITWVILISLIDVTPPISGRNWRRVAILLIERGIRVRTGRARDIRAKCSDITQDTESDLRNEISLL